MSYYSSRDSSMPGWVWTIIIVVIFIFLLRSCSEQTKTRNFGGEMTVDLPVNQKLEMITWKDDELWYLTKPMTEDDVAETHTFQESSVLGVWEGTVTVVEHKKE